MLASYGLFDRHWSSYSQRNSREEKWFSERYAFDCHWENWDCTVRRYARESCFYVVVFVRDSPLRKYPYAASVLCSLYCLLECVLRGFSELHAVVEIKVLSCKSCFVEFSVRQKADWLIAFQREKSIEYKWIEVRRMVCDEQKVSLGDIFCSFYPLNEEKKWRV